MKRFRFWRILNRLNLKLNMGVGWLWLHYNDMTFRFSGYCLDQMKSEIPDEYQDQLVDREDIDPSCEELGCWDNQLIERDDV